MANRVTKMTLILRTAWRGLRLGALVAGLILPVPFTNHQALADEPATEHSRIEEDVIGSWAVDHVRRNTGAPLKLTNKHVRGGIEIRPDRSFFLFIAYAVADSDDPEIKALAGVLPEQAVASGTYKIFDGVLAYTVERVGGPPFEKGDTNYRKLSFEGDNLMVLTACSPSGPMGPSLVIA